MADASVSSIQSGSLSIASADGLTITASITSVDTTRSIVMYSTRNSDAATRVLRHSFTAELSASSITFTRVQSASAAAVVIEWTVIEFEAASIASVQRGVLTRSTASDAVTLTSVDTTAAFPILTGKCDSSNGADLGVMATLAATALTISAFNAPTGIAVIAWQVIEFAQGVSVQAVALTLSSTETSGTATITSVDTAKTFVAAAGNESRDTIYKYGGYWTLTDSTTIELFRADVGTLFAYPATCYVVELSGASQSVESFAYTILDGASAPSAQPSWAALSTTKTAIMHPLWLGAWTWDYTNSGFGDPANLWPSISLAAGADGATVQRGGTAGDLVVAGFAVDWTVGGGATTPTDKPTNLMLMGMS